MRITSKTVHNINKMEDNFELRYVFTYPGIISRADLLPSPRAYASGTIASNLWKYQHLGKTSAHARVPEKIARNLRLFNYLK
jgi:hypothetical protein